MLTPANRGAPAHPPAQPAPCLWQVSSLFRWKRPDGFQEQAVYDQFHRMIASAIERDFFIKLADLAVHARPHKTLLQELFKKLLEFTFSPPHHRRQNHDAIGCRAVLTALLHQIHDG